VRLKKEERLKTNFSPPKTGSKKPVCSDLTKSPLHYRPGASYAMLFCIFISWQHPMISEESNIVTQNQKSRLRIGALSHIYVTSYHFSFICIYLFYLFVYFISPLVCRISAVDPRSVRVAPPLAPWCSRGTAGSWGLA
jgi:hypothetical protein